MPLPRLIPCLDVAGGRVVKGVRFQGLRDVGDPVELGGGVLGRRSRRARLPRRQGDARGSRGTLVSLVRAVAERLAIPFTVGGGVRSVADGEALLAAGADKVAVNSAALERPALIGELADALGSQAVVAAIDTEGGRVRRGRRHRRRARRRRLGARGREARGAGEILLTSIDADGTRNGYDLELTAAVADAVDLPVIASGGAGNADTSQTALGVAQAALLASILHEDACAARLAARRAAGARNPGSHELARDRPGRRDGPCADARVDERRGASG